MIQPWLCGTFRAETIQEVLDGDRLDAGVNPLGADHDRQTLNKVTDHLERDAARADDYGGPEFRDRDTRLAERLSCLLPRAKVQGQLGFRLAQSTKVDDTADSRFPWQLDQKARASRISVSWNPAPQDML